MKIHVNGRASAYNESHITYEQIVQLANKHGNPTVTYHVKLNGDMARSGGMHPGCDPVKVDEGMSFNVMHTGAA